MTVVGGMEIGRELAKNLAQINRLINEVNHTAESMGIESHKLRDSTGGLVLAPLVVAKAQSLHALVLVNQRRS